MSDGLRNMALSIGCGSAAILFANLALYEFTSPPTRAKTILAAAPKRGFSLCQDYWDTRSPTLPAGAGIRLAALVQNSIMAILENDPRTKKFPEVVRALTPTEDTYFVHRLKEPNGDVSYRLGGVGIQANYQKVSWKVNIAAGAEGGFAAVLSIKGDGEQFYLRDDTPEFSGKLIGAVQKVVGCLHLQRAEKTKYAGMVLGSG